MQIQYELQIWCLAQAGSGAAEEELKEEEREKHCSSKSVAE